VVTVTCKMLRKKMAANLPPKQFFNQYSWSHE
jgi:hypothetical protein